MYDTTKNFIQRLRGDKRKQKQLGLMLLVLSLIVASGVTWQLRITGITMSDVPCCGLEEHVHTPECTERTLICGLTEGDSEEEAEELPPAEPELVCDISEHTHGDGCYHIQQELICDVAEHSHGDGCYEIEWVLDCEEDHEHDENCPQKEIKTLVCDIPEHTHGEGCYYIEKELICDIPEHVHGDECYRVAETEAPHVHTEECWETKHICGYNEEHTHTLACYSNPDADVESPSQWESTLPSLTGNRAADLAAVARSQVNYRESDDNFIVSEDGVSRRGITRYGQWYGNPYGEWDAMFAVFCLRYAGIGESVIPGNSGCYAWAAQLGQLGMFRSPSDHNPAPGDLVFFDQDEDGTPDHVGIVIRADGPFFSAVEGGRENCVDIYSYDRSDGCVFGFVPVEEEEPEETAEESTEETLPEDLFPQALNVIVYEDAAFEQWVEGAVPMTVSGLMPEGLTAKACPVSGVLEGREVLWAFFIGLYDGDGRLWQSPEEPLTVTMTVPNYLDELTEDQEPAQPLIYYVPAEGPEEEIPCERAGELLAFEISSGATYASALPEPELEPEPETLKVLFFEDETYEVPLEDAPEMTVTGILPEMAEARAYLVELELPEAEVLWAFHLAVFNEEGELIEPEALTANLQMPQTYAMDTENAISMYQLSPDGQQEPVPTQQTETDITFEATKPAVYAAITREASLRNAITSGQGSYVLQSNETVEGGTLEITGDFVLDLNGYTLTAATSEPLFTVKEGTLTVKDGGTGNSEPVSVTYLQTTSTVTNSAVGATREDTNEITVTAAGRIAAGSQPVFQINGGTLKLENAMIGGGTNRAIELISGTANLSGGCIYDFNLAEGMGGAVLMQGGTMNITGTVITNNQATDGGAIRVTGGTINIEGGTISGNIANGTTGVRGGGGIYAANSVINMKSGFLSNNKVLCDVYWSGGGGAMMESGAVFNLSGGYVTANESGCGGGGLMVHNESNGVINMSGGYVCGNVGHSAEGGGISIERGGKATITSGYINNNRIPVTDHWGGGGLFCADATTVTMSNVLVTQNSCGGLGGGVAGCNTGNLNLYAQNGIAIYDNADGDKDPNWCGTASSYKFGVDQELCNNPIFLGESGEPNLHKDLFCALHCYIGGKMLGGGAYNWFGSMDDRRVTIGADEFAQARRVLGLTSAPTPESKQAAQNAAAQNNGVYINGNYSYTHGGGILCNGLLVVGTPEKVYDKAHFTLSGDKSLLNALGEKMDIQSGQFEFELLDGERKQLELVSCLSDGKIPFEFEGVYEFEDSEEETRDYIYYVREIPPETQADPETGSVILYDQLERRITVTVSKVETPVPRELNLTRSASLSHSYFITHVKVEKGTYNAETGEWTVVSTPLDYDNTPEGSWEFNNPGWDDRTHFRLQLSDENTRFTNRVFENLPISIGAVASKRFIIGTVNQPMTPGQFTFEVRDGNNNLLGTVTNIRDENLDVDEWNNKIDFGEVLKNCQFEEARDYCFHISEVPGPADDGITYDPTKYTIKVSVGQHQIGEGDSTFLFIDEIQVFKNDELDPIQTIHLEGEWAQAYTVDLNQGATDWIAFNNAKYESKFHLSATKQMKNAAGDNIDLEAGQFTFDIYTMKDQDDDVDEESERICEAVNGASVNGAVGSVTWDPVVITAEGDHYYAIRERQPDEVNGTSYDSTRYILKLTTARKVIWGTEKLVFTEYRITDSSGNELYQYTVPESEDYNFKEDCSLVLPENKQNGGTPAFTNQEQENTSITVVKRWVDFADGHPDSVKVWLYQHSGGQNLIYQGTGIENPVTLSEANGWTAAWENLPLKSEDGQTSYTYTVEEEKSDSYVGVTSYEGENGKNLDLWVPVSGVPASGGSEKYLLISDGHVLSLPESNGSNSVPAVRHEGVTVDGIGYSHWYEVDSLPPSAPLTDVSLFWPFNGKIKLGNGDNWLRVSEDGDALTTGTGDNFGAISIENGQIQISRYTFSQANNNSSLASEWRYITWENGKFVPTQAPGSQNVQLYKQVVQSASGGVTVTITNSPKPETPEYDLPKTGGSGTGGFIFLGLVLMASSLGWWIYQRNRKEGRAF